MPKMTHWNSPDTINVSAEKAAVYAAQGWVAEGAAPKKVQPAITAMTTAATDEPAKPAAKKAPAKRATKKAAKKS